MRHWLATPLLRLNGSRGVYNWYIEVQRGGCLLLVLGFVLALVLVSR